MSNYFYTTLFKWSWKRIDDADTMIGIFRTKEKNSLDNIVRVVCKQSKEGECNYQFHSQGTYYFSSGYVEKDSKVSFAVTVIVDVPPQTISSNIKIEVNGEKKFISLELMFVLQLEALKKS